MRQASLDTDILSYVTDERYPAVSEQARQYYRVFRYFTVSSITVAEVVEGLARIHDYPGIESFLKRAEGFEILPVDFDEAVIAGKIFAALAESGQKIGEQDPFIAAVAIAAQSSAGDNCAFQSKADTNSNAKRTVIPIESGHLFQSKADRNSSL